MGEQVRFFDRNVLDQSNSNIVFTITDAVASNKGDDFIGYVQNRKNSSAWLTTGSTDAANTTIDVNLVDTEEIDSIILIGHNFKAYTIQYWDGGSYVDFSTAINESTNTAETTYHSFTAVNTNKIKLIIDSCTVVDADKILKQFIVTKSLGQLAGYPVIKKPTQDRASKKTSMLSGKVNLTTAVGAFSCSLDFKTWKNDTDWTLIETIYDKPYGVLMWLCGGDESQFSTVRKSYRLEDIYLVKPTTDYTPEYVDGIYVNGIKQAIKFEETI